MKKFFTFLMVIMTVFTGLGLMSNAAVVSEPSIMPCYNNTENIDVRLHINSSGKATISINCTGKEGVTSKITSVTYLQRKVGIIWVKVDNGLNNKEWTDTVYTTNMSKTHTLQLEKTGTYRVKAEITINGSGGASDVVNETTTATY